MNLSFEIKKIELSQKRNTLNDSSDSRMSDEFKRSRNKFESNLDAKQKNEQQSSKLYAKKSNEFEIVVVVIEITIFSKNHIIVTKKI